MLKPDHIKQGDEVIVLGQSYIVEDIEPNGWFFAIGNNGEEMEGTSESVDAHFPAPQNNYP